MTARYTDIAEIYDVVYQTRKNYREEAAKIRKLTRLKTRGRVSCRRLSLLDVACGTGLHLEHFVRSFGHVEGLDLSEEMLAVARARLPDVPLHRGDMLDFQLGRRFDVITCLFSAIGHMKRLTDLRRAVMTMSDHLAAGGVLFIEPWLEPDELRPGAVHAYLADTLEVKVAHVNVSSRRRRVSIHELHYLVGRSTGVTGFVEVHELGLYTKDQYRSALTRAGLTVSHDRAGLAGRGLFIGVKAAT